MYAHCAKSPIGYFAFDDHGQVIYFELFSRDIASVNKALGEPVPPAFIKEVKGYTAAEDKTGEEFMRLKMRELALSMNFVKGHDELNEFIHDLGIAHSKQRLGGAIGKDKLLISAINGLDELTKGINTFSERLYEWFSLHYPEIDMEKEKLVEHVAMYGRRDNFPQFSQSLGVEFSKEDEQVIKQFAHSIMELEKSRKDMENYIKYGCKMILKNVSSIVDPLLAARILAHAGSLEKLAKMPSSTIQLLGAEKALFRHLKHKGSSPKYGILFMSAKIQNAPDQHRGKIARILASAIMRAARIDLYSERDDSEKLISEVNSEIKNVMQ